MRELASKARRIAAAAGILFLHHQALAQTADKPAEPAPANITPVPVTEDNVKSSLMLVRTSLIALDQANATGNYTVFQALTAPGMRQRFTPADYTDYYAPLRKQKLQLGVTAISELKLAKSPFLDANGFLHFEGAVQTAPTPVNFKLVLAKVEDRWMIMALDVDVTAPNTAAVAQAPAAPTTDKPAKQAQAAKGAPSKDASAKPAADKPTSTWQTGFAGR